jgi:hypothetical protein
MEPSFIMKPLTSYLVYPYERLDDDSVLCLVTQPIVEHEWLETTRDRALSIDGGPMWFTDFTFRM